MRHDNAKLSIMLGRSAAYVPISHFEYGGCHSQTSSHGSNQSSCVAHAAQKPSGSAAAFS